MLTIGVFNSFGGFLGHPVFARLITGDFNCNFLAPENNQDTTKLTDLLNEYQLE